MLTSESDAEPSWPSEDDLGSWTPYSAGGLRVGFRVQDLAYRALCTEAVITNTGITCGHKHGSDCSIGNWRSTVFNGTEPISFR